MDWFIKLLAGVFLTVPISAHAEEQVADDQWRFVLKPLYVWLMTLDGSTTIPPSNDNSGGTTNFDDSELTGAFSFHFEAGKDKWNVFTDYLFAEYTSKNVNISSSPVQGTNRLTTHIAELGATYRALEHPRYLLELLGGVRYLYVANKFNFNFNNNALNPLSTHENIWDGFGGIRFTGFLTDSISSTVRADVGAGSSELVWNLIASIDWRYQNWGSVYAGYRVLDYKFSDNSLDLNLQGKGPVIGLGFYW